MIKPILAIAGAAAVIGTSIYVSTQVGLQAEGWHDVVVEIPRNPGYAAVGQTYATPDGSKVLITAVTREQGKHFIHARVQGTHRYALALFPTHWEHSFAMDRPSLDWTLRQAARQTPEPLDHAVGRQWHVLN